jgi:DNA-binding NarL/FixJ family response regulator
MVEKQIVPQSIMITDDHSVIRRTLREWLSEEFPGIRVVENSSGEAALEMLASQTLPEIVLMDFHLPGQSGITVIKQIKKDHPDLPVVMLTIQEDKQYREKALEAGADEYVVKRRMYTDLIPAVQNALDKSSSGTAQSNPEVV